MRAEYRASELSDGEFYEVTADMAKDGSADTAVIVYRVTPGDYMFTFKEINAFTINSTDYQIVANELKKCIMRYDAALFTYDANGIKRPVPICFSSYHWGIKMLTVNA